MVSVGRTVGATLAPHSRACAILPSLRSPRPWPAVRSIFSYLVHRSNVIFADPKAARRIWGAGFHGYDHSRFDNVRLHHGPGPTGISRSTTPAVQTTSGNLCSAPILCDLEKDALLPQNSYHYIGHFSHFIRPGARRILCASTRDDLEATAFVNTDGSIALVARQPRSSRPAASSRWSCRPV